jgi:DNA-binding transcriptional ArsR family regulator
VDAVFRALGDPVRVAILEELHARNDQSLFELCIRLNGRGMARTRQAVSKHIGVLRDSGLVQATTQGRTTIHHLDLSALNAARAWIESMTGETP